MADYNVTDLSVELIGTPDSVAARMGEVMEEVGGDGFLFSMPNVNRRTLAEIEDGLVPALQDRGLVRDRVRARAVPRQSVWRSDWRLPCHHDADRCSTVVPSHCPWSRRRRPSPACIAPSARRGGELAGTHLDPRQAEGQRGGAHRQAIGGSAQEAQRKAYFEPFGRLAGIKVMDFAGADINKVKAMVETKQRRVGRGPAQPRHRAQPDEARRLFRKIDYDLVDTTTSIKYTATTTRWTCWCGPR